uniref:Uncharacterized protein n=1 Tax=Molossus molossus TaxID=27622 RepID=A0A7J8DTG0_MOLMO|nr:hypothetical protein HJG59_009200 [Molossus molossus]
MDSPKHCLEDPPSALKPLVPTPIPSRPLTVFMETRQSAGPCHRCRDYAGQSLRKGRVETEAVAGGADASRGASGDRVFPPPGSPLRFGTRPVGLCSVPEQARTWTDSLVPGVPGFGLGVGRELHGSPSSVEDSSTECPQGAGGHHASCALGGR